MQADKPLKRKKQKRCLYCHSLFEPDYRTKGKQRYCSNKACQNYRQRQNEKSWRSRNPECVKLQREQSRKWHKDRPGYSCQRRSADPVLLKRNCRQTRKRMQNLRIQKMFDKSKLILTQLAGNKADKCFLTKGSKWVYVRLTKASPLSKWHTKRHNLLRVKAIANYLPYGKLYDLSAIFSRGPSHLPAVSNPANGP